MNEENFSDKTKSKRRITFDSNELRCIVSPCKIFNSQYNELSYQIFDFWRRSWTDTFKQIDKDFAQTSEEYCRHHRVVALQYQGEIIACALLDLFDLHSPIHKEHKYFLAYPTPVYSDFLKLAETGPVMTVGYLTVDPRFKLQPFIAQLLSGLCLLHYYSSETQLLITYTRNTKRVNQLAFRFGGIPIAENLIAFGEPTDFVYFTQQQLMSLQQHPYFEDFYSFWNERLEITHTQHFQRRSINEKTDSSNRLQPDAGIHQRT